MSIYFYAPRLKFVPYSRILYTILYIEEEKGAAQKNSTKNLKLKIRCDIINLPQHYYNLIVSHPSTLCREEEVHNSALCISSNN